MSFPNTGPKSAGSVAIAAADPTDRVTIWRRVRQARAPSFKAFVTSAIIIALLVFNLLTLLSAEIHDLAFGVLDRVVQAIASKPVAAQVMQRSSRVRTQAARAEEAQVRAANRLLAENNVRLVKEREGFERENSELKQKAVRQASIVKRIASSVVGRSATGVARKIALLPGEAVPFAGTAILVAMTAFDLYELCESVKELAELGHEFGLEPEDSRAVCGVRTPTRDHILRLALLNWREAYDRATQLLKTTAPPGAPPELPPEPWADVKGKICSRVGMIPGLCP